MRTLVISDLHLGSRLGRDVLRHPEALAVLLEALAGFDRLVLLGDVVELAEGRPRQALAVAEPVLRAIGTRMGRERPIVVVPGNHDRALARTWARAQGDALIADALVPHDATALLARLVGWLAPAPVEVRTPGVWLSDRVWATHGHYLDRHLAPRSPWGLRRAGLRGNGRRIAPAVVGPAPYERAHRPRTQAESRLTRRLPRPLATVLEDGAELMRAATMPTSRRLHTHRAAPLTRILLGAQMQRASIPALTHAAARIGVDADWVVFGHVHRSGPRDGDDPDTWAAPGGRPRVANSGSWVYEPLLLHRGMPPHPYWPGGAVVVEGDADPQAIGLLDAVDAHALFARDGRLWHER
ncbi:MAG TPA: metallophosphoesterase [Baekduia sp.]|nr:metallophosphoesterase [Baekduia sp.]